MSIHQKKETRGRMMKRRRPAAVQAPNEGSNHPADEISRSGMAALRFYRTTRRPPRKGSDAKDRSDFGARRIDRPGSQFSFRAAARAVRDRAAGWQAGAAAAIPPGAV